MLINPKVKIQRAQFRVLQAIFESSSSWRHKRLLEPLLIEGEVGRFEVGDFLLSAIKQVAI